VSGLLKPKIESKDRGEAPAKWIAASEAKGVPLYAIDWRENALIGEGPTNQNSAVTQSITEAKAKGSALHPIEWRENALIGEGPTNQNSAVRQ
jgi:hypothetical protein